MKKVRMILIYLILAISITAGCNQRNQNSKDLKENPMVISLAKEVMYFDEFLYYITLYESYGEYNAEYYSHFFEVEDYWSTIADENGNTNSTLLKENAYKEAISDMILADCAKKEGLTLSQEQTSEIDTYTKEFLNRYQTNALIKDYVSENGINKALRRKYLANNYEQYLKDELKIEDSLIGDLYPKEDYREYKTEYLFLQISKYDKNNKRIELTEKEKEENLSIMNEVLEKAKEGVAFNDIKINFKEKVELTYTTRDFNLQNSTIEKAYINASMELENNEISDIVEGDFGYYIIKMLDNNSFDNYEQTIKDAITTKTNEAFTEQFNEIKASYKPVINEDIKDQLNFGSISLLIEE